MTLAQALKRTTKLLRAWHVKQNQGTNRSMSLRSCKWCGHGACTDTALGSHPGTKRS